MDGPDVDPDNLGLLAVWNPLILPETIAAHVKALRESPAGDRRCWWGRIDRGRASSRGAKWDWTRHLDLDRERVLLVTSHVALHALRVDRIVRGTLPVDEQVHVPRYYGAQDAVALWFRVRDIRAVSWSQLKTLQILDQLSEVARDGEGRWRASGWPVDIYASRAFEWPALVTGDVAMHAWFDDGREWWNRPDTLASGNVLDARSRLAAEHPFWQDLDPGSQLSIATAEALDGHFTDRSDVPFDVAAVAIGWTRAAELELCRRLCRERVIPFVREVERRTGHPLVAPDSIPPDLRVDGKRDPALGTAAAWMQLLAPEFAKRQMAASAALGTRAQQAMLRVAAHRNTVAHGRDLPSRDLDELKRLLGDGDGLLALALRAQRELDDQPLTAPS